MKATAYRRACAAPGPGRHHGPDGGSARDAATGGAESSRGTLVPGVAVHGRRCVSRFVDDLERETVHCVDRAHRGNDWTAGGPFRSASPSNRRSTRARSEVVADPPYHFRRGGTDRQGRV